MRTCRGPVWTIDRRALRIGGRCRWILRLATLTALATTPHAKADKELVMMEEPFSVLVPADVAATWNTIGTVLPRWPPSGAALRIQPPLEPPGRVDYMIRSNGSWRWVAGRSFDRELGELTLPAESTVGVLLRQTGRKDAYGWLELDGHHPPPTVAVPMLQTLRFPASSPADAWLFVADESAPRLAASTPGGLRFERVPVSPALLCAARQELAACSEFKPGESTVRMPTGPFLPVRLFRVGSEAQSPNVVRPRTVTYSRAVGFETRRAGHWVALVLTHESEDWADLVVDFSAADLATVRIDGGMVLPPPTFESIEASRERGLAVRVVVGPERRPLDDPDARLAFIHRDAPRSDRFAADIVKPDVEGVFRSDQLPGGSYELKLLGASASGNPARATLEPGSVVEVSVDPGLVVSGRVRAGGGSSPEPARVSVVRRTPLGSWSDLSRKGLPEISDWARSVEAEPDGSFRLALTLPGPYRLLARWGQASARRDFLIEGGTRTLNLGDILVTDGASMRGTFESCGGGELLMAPYPDTASPAQLSVFDFRRTAIKGDGQFLVEGLTGGSWLLGAVCDGRRVSVLPTIVNIPDEGVLFEILGLTESPGTERQANTTISGTPIAPGD